MQQDDGVANAEAAFASARSLLGQGENLKAHDLAARWLESAPEHEGLRHTAVLALARMGATDMARTRFHDLGLDRVDSEEALALTARLSKDAALADPAHPDATHLATSIDAYRRAFAIDRGYYPAINVATLSLLAGRTGDAAEWARIALADADAQLKDHGYYAEATRAEALLLLGRTSEAEASVARAAALAGGDYASRATTLKQLRLICRHSGLEDGLLAPLKPPGIVHFFGHMIAAPERTGRFPADQEDEVRRAIEAHFAAQPCSHAIGSLAAGADIMAVEAALAAGAAVDIVMPFDRDEFIEQSVAPSGPGWVQRFHRCYDAARQVHFVTGDAYLGDDELFGYATEYALGLARLRAQWLATDLTQLAVWDGETGPSAAGTSHDLEMGRRAGCAQTVIPVRSNREPVPAPSEDTTPGPEGRVKRVRRTMIFGDLKGFSRLTDGQLPAYVEHVLGAVAGVLDAKGGRLVFRNTWGDGIFLVFDDLAAAADCAFALQEAMAAIDREALGLPDTLGLRLGFHYGPVYVTRDPVLDRSNCFGFHVSRAARIEPITPEGSVYVTEQTAAALAVACPDAYRCDYVGRQPLAKGYGEFPMYHLRRTGGPVSP